MIRLTTIQDALMGVVGWEQSYDPAKQIDKALCASESGLTYQGAHPLCTLENIRSIMPEDYTNAYPLWDKTVQYVVGKKVRHGGFVWICNADNINVEPTLTGTNGSYNDDYGVSADEWVVYPYESDYIRNLTKQAVNAVVQRFLQEKQLTQETRSLLERRTLFDGAARLESILTPTGKIVGLEIVPVRSMGVTAKIERIGLQMIGDTGRVTMYLFHSSQVDAIRTVELDYTNTSGGFQWFTPAQDIYLPYIGENTDDGGAWYLVYNQEELPQFMRALNVAKDWSRGGCTTCNKAEGIKEITKYLQISPFKAGVPDDWPKIFDNGLLAYTSTVNYGINLEISIACDLTDFIVRQRDIFATVLQKQVAAQVLRTIAMNPDVRVNRNQVNVTRDELLYELDGSPQGKAFGLGYELNLAFKALSLDTRNLDRVCLSCNNHGVKYRTV